MDINSIWEEIMMIGDAFSPEELRILQDVLTAFMGIFITIGAIALIWNLLVYILQAVSVYSVAKRRGINHAWLAWIPLTQYWTLGAISDHYQRTVNGKATKRRVVLILLAIAGPAMAALVSGINVFNVLKSIETAMEMDWESALMMESTVSGVSGLVSFLSSGVSITLFVFWHIALYDYYRASCPQYTVVLLILGIVFPVTVPFFLFFNRKKDAGMQPAQFTEIGGYAPYQNQWQYPNQNSWQPPQNGVEPWNQQ